MMSEFIIKKFIYMMESGYVPDFIIRFGIRKLLKNRIQELHQHSDLNKYIQSYATELKNSPLAIMTKQANDQHYEVPTEYYDLCLGEHKKYSSCYWDESIRILEDAERKSLDISIEHAEIHDGMRILELGCGWGSLSLELARRFPNSQITSVSNSKTQKKYIDQKAQERGLKNLEILTLDLGRQESYKFPQEHFDRIMSIEMMEHLRNYELFFKLLAPVMKNDAKFFIHIFNHKSHPYFFETEGADNWMGQYFFSGGQMPSRDLFDQFSSDLQVQKKWDWNGQHYQKTLEAWLERMDLFEIKIREIFAQAYGTSNVEKWFNRWRVFYMACSELFGFNKGLEWGVTHYLLTKKVTNEK